jgi:hypothetical protein
LMSRMACEHRRRRSAAARIVVADVRGRQPATLVPVASGQNRRWQDGKRATTASRKQARGASLREGWERGSAATAIPLRPSPASGRRLPPAGEGSCGGVLSSCGSPCMAWVGSVWHNKVKVLFAGTLAS